MPVFYITHCHAACADCEKRWHSYGWEAFARVLSSVRAHAKRTGHCVEVDQTRVYDYGTVGGR